MELVVLEIVMVFLHLRFFTINVITTIVLIILILIISATIIIKKISCIVICRIYLGLESQVQSYLIWTSHAPKFPGNSSFLLCYMDVELLVFQNLSEINPRSL